MKKLKKILILSAIAAAIITSSGCDYTQPAINPEVSSSESSSIEIIPEEVLPESSSESSSESSEPEIIEEEPAPEPIPEPVVHISSTEVQKGTYLTVCVENIDLYGCSFTDFLGYERTFLGKNGDWYCFIPVKTAAEAGEYTLEFAFDDFSYSETITVTERDLYTQYLVVDEKTLEETIENDAIRAAFDYFYQKYRWTYTGVALWEGEFVHPLGNRYYKETTRYGTFRTFSNGDTEWHNAIDMAIAGGTPIQATNRGRVIFSGWLGVSGNTVLIDHGFGVISWHYHLYKRSVSVGDMVEKDQVIGEVGTTGLSTGNHLHFAISVGGIFVDPMEIIGTVPEFDFWAVEE